MQVPPSNALAAIVKHYLVLESDKNVPLNYRLFSDGNPGIVFHYKDPLRHNTGTQPQSFIYGQITHYNDVSSCGNVGIVVAVLQPFGIYPLLGIPANELNNSVISLPDIFRQEATDLEDKVQNIGTPYAIIALVEQFLLKKLRSDKLSDPVFTSAVGMIYQQKGNITIENLLKNIPVTERQLERKFKQYTGISPYKFAEINKFQNFLKLLQRHPEGENISALIYESGYYDQSHLNGWFKKIAGITPLQYKKNNNLLAINFMQLR